MSGFEDAGNKPLPHFLGHRERLKERFRESGPDAMPDYELLEMLLFRDIKRGDTKPIAAAAKPSTARRLIPKGLEQHRQGCAPPRR